MKQIISLFHLSLILSTMDSLELWSTWKDRSKELFSLITLPLEVHERKDILKQFNITQNVIND
jgi:hypothetical protein